MVALFFCHRVLVLVGWAWSQARLMGAVQQIAHLQVRQSSYCMIDEVTMHESTNHQRACRTL